MAGSWASPAARAASTPAAGPAPGAALPGLPAPLLRPLRGWLGVSGACSDPARAHTLRGARRKVARLSIDSSAAHSQGLPPAPEDPPHSALARPGPALTLRAQTTCIVPGQAHRAVITAAEARDKAWPARARAPRTRPAGREQALGSTLGEHVPLMHHRLVMLLAPCCRPACRPAHHPDMPWHAEAFGLQPLAAWRHALCAAFLAALCTAAGEHAPGTASGAATCACCLAAWRAARRASTAALRAALRAAFLAASCADSWAARLASAAACLEASCTASSIAACSLATLSSVWILVRGWATAGSCAAQRSAAQPMWAPAGVDLSSAAGQRSPCRPSTCPRLRYAGTVGRQASLSQPHAALSHDIAAHRRVQQLQAPSASPMQAGGH